MRRVRPALPVQLGELEREVQKGLPVKKVKGATGVQVKPERADQEDIREKKGQLAQVVLLVQRVLVVKKEKWVYLVLPVQPEKKEHWYAWEKR